MLTGQTGYFHEDNGPFQKGVPTKPGYYWFKAHGDVSVCKVLHGGPHQGGTWGAAVVTHGGWRRPEGTPPPKGAPDHPDYRHHFSLDDPFVQEAEYAPMSPPGGW